VLGLAIATAVILILALPFFRSKQVGDTMYTREVPSGKTAEETGMVSPGPNAQAPPNYASEEAPKQVGEAARVMGMVRPGPNAQAPPNYASEEAPKQVGEAARVMGMVSPGPNAQAPPNYTPEEAPKQLGETQQQGGAWSVSSRPNAQAPPTHTADELTEEVNQLSQAGKYSEAIPIAKSALDLREKALGPEDLDTAISLNNLAGLYQQMGDYAKAEPLYQRSLKIYEKVLGPEDLDTAISLDNLAGLYQQMGDYAKAEPLYQQILRIKEKKLGATHPATFASVSRLAQLYDKMGEHDKAQLLYQRLQTVHAQSPMPPLSASYGAPFALVGAGMPNYTPEETAKHVGEMATVTGKIDGVHQSGKGNIFLNMGGKYPHQAFTAWVPSASAAQFPNPQQYEGQTVSVSGKITLYRGKPEIIVTSPSQIKTR
jgi:tetratricopeptide (TPR) repeat protein